MLNVTVDQGLVWVTAGEQLTEADYDRFEPIFEKIAERTPGTVPMVIELKPDFDGWDLRALWREVKFGMRHHDSYSLIAVVGDKKLKGWGTKLSDPLFPSARIQFYSPEDRAKAEHWARQDEE
ncbi:hypothetical protein DEA8626_01197 [Defluviimonas aquaemixtae]|uniref:STAS/SEC14 domain-containing protein n=1 Tax=Albidovulum aquaemixtae TaxID=1542388 RepID=A0A2R8B585_9RHOB|nr:STAS/SEC14 domain-containing protein [Defluviimonas aquaemixtae]SPH17673.1 hypothetical protein DEA8626_01197 [Defluviimonas aquaemixtae]